MLNEQIAKKVGPAHLDIAWEQRGDPKHPTVLLVMGVAAQLVNWPIGFHWSRSSCTSCASTTATRGTPRT
jgi:hypothetical protein